MMQTKVKPKDVDQYIAGFSEDVQPILRQIRATIREVAPDVEEAIKYAMPTFILHGDLVYFAAFKNHIGFYATPTGHEAFSQELAAYKTGKGSVQFPLDQPMPLSLIAKLVKFRVDENVANSKAKPKQHNQ